MYAYENTFCKLLQIRFNSNRMWKYIFMRYFHEFQLRFRCLVTLHRILLHPHSFTMCGCDGTSIDSCALFQVVWTIPIDQIPPSINRDITSSHTKSLDIPALPPCLALVLPTFRGIRLENLCLKECRFQCASVVRCASWWSLKFWEMTSAGGSLCVRTTSMIRQSAMARTKQRYHLTLSSLRLRSSVS